MAEPLVTYVQDHLAGASHALELLEWMKHEHRGDPLGSFVAALHAEIAKDRDVLTSLAEELGGGTSSIKETGAWLSEKVSRLKLADHGHTRLGTFEALEFLVLGIHGKRALWHALRVVAENDAKLRSLNFAELIARAETQEARVDAKRLEVARTVLVTGKK